MSCKKNIFFIVLFLLFNLCCCAQEKSSQYVYQDSSIMNEGAEEIYETEASAKDGGTVDTIQKKEVDTILRNNELAINRDSIKVIKYSSSFAYARNLDSMLHALEAEKNANIKVSDDGPSLLDHFFASIITQVFLWSLAALFVAFILYKLFFTQGVFLRQSDKKMVGTVEEEQENDFGKKDYDQLIAAAISNKNYRLAVRYLYLKSLQKLAASGAISFAADKTNFQYLSELTGKSYKKEFSRLMLAYEYTWYGEFELDETKFTQIYAGFNNFNNQL